MTTTIHTTPNNNIDLFVECIKADHLASEKIISINDDIEAFDEDGKNTEHLYILLDEWIIKQHEARKPLNHLVAIGAISENTLSTCDKQLGDYIFYATDIFPQLLAGTH